MVKIMMKDDSIKELNGYSDIPSYIGHELVFFETYGSYSGDWIMVSKKENTIYLRRGYYGSCSLCDNYYNFEMEEPHDEDYNSMPYTQDKGDGFVYAYSPEEEHNIKDINKDMIYEYIKKQQLSGDYEYLPDEKCMSIATDIIKSLLPTTK